MYWTPWVYWRRATSTTNSAPYEIFWCRGGPWMDCTRKQHSKKRRWRRNDGNWRWRRQGRWPQGHLAPTDAPSRCSCPSNTWGECYWRQTMTGHRRHWWYKTWQSRGRFGRKFQGSWAGSVRGHGFPNLSLNPSSNQCCSLVQRRGWVPPVWDGSWGVSKTRWHGDWWGGFHSWGWEESGSTPCWMQRDRRRCLSRWKPTFGKGIIQSHSIL